MKINNYLLLPFLLLISCGIKDVKFYHGEGLNYERDGNIKEAVISYKKGLTLNDSYYPILFNLGNYYYCESNFKEAKKYFIKSIISETNSYKSYFNLALTYLKLGENVKSEKTFEHALKINNHEDIVYIAFGRFLLDNKFYKKAEKVLLEGMKKVPKSSKIVSLLAEAYLLQGEQKKSIELLKKVVASDNNYLINRVFVKSFLQMKKYKKAKEYLDKLGNKENLDNSILRASYFVENKIWNKAKKILEKITDRYPDEYEVRLLYGKFYLEQNRYVDAIKQYQLAVNIKYKEKLPRIRIASIYLKQKKYNDAKKVLLYLVNFYPKNTEILRKLVVVYFKKKHYERVISYGLKYTNIEKKDLEINKLLGISYIKTDDLSIRNFQNGIKYLYPLVKTKYSDDMMITLLKKTMKDVGDTRKLK